MLQFKIKLEDADNTPVLVFQHSASKEKLEEQIFDSLVDDLLSNGKVLQATRTIENGVVKVNFKAVHPSDI